MKKLLVANRGEIALRILRTAREMGIRTVQVVSEADEQTPAAQFADEVVVLGPAPVTRSYLNQDAILNAARTTGADAIHPGYGFLSENAGFARSVIEAGLTWVGPSPEAIELMGDKARARATAMAAGVPVLAGSNGIVDADADVWEIGADIGFPLLIKASAGGGGRGIRLVESPQELDAALEVARAEAQAAFGSGDLYLERFVRHGRHVEVQVLSDGETVLHLGDRDCSMQRKQQKVIEEAPAPDLPEDIREMIRASAVKLARACRYVGAGTVEYLYDSDREEVAFLEMNTRLQVEHPITEMITGIDLVREQLRIARGEPLGYRQEDVTFVGHACEFRVNAEDPAQNFMPSPGTITRLDVGAGPGVRLDFGVRAGSVVTPFYDSLIGKIIVWAPTRRDAIERSLRVLRETRIEGIETTIPFITDLVSRTDFAEATHHTTTIQTILDRSSKDEP